MGLKELLIERTANTPEIDFNNLSGELVLEGRSIPANAANIYSKAYEWVQQYIKSPQLTTNLRLNLEYFNTASTIWIAKIIRALNTMPYPNNILILHLYLSIDEIEDLDVEDVKDILTSIVDLRSNPVISFCVKLYGLSDDNVVLRESAVFV